MPWFTVRTREVWDATHLVEAATPEEAIQNVIEGRSDGISEFAYLLKDDIECEEAEPPSEGRLQGSSPVVAEVEQPPLRRRLPSRL